MFIYSILLKKMEMSYLDHLFICNIVFKCKLWFTLFNKKERVTLPMLIWIWSCWCYIHCWGESQGSLTVSLLNLLSILHISLFSLPQLSLSILRFCVIELANHISPCCFWDSSPKRENGVMFNLNVSLK